MRFATRVSFTLLAILLIGFAMPRPAPAASYNITWLSMAPTAVGNTVPSGSVYVVPGIGTVTLTYTAPSPPQSINLIRQSSPSVSNLNVTSGGDLYSWTTYEQIAGTMSATPLGPFPYSITYTFSQSIPAGALYLTTGGLGRTSQAVDGQGGFAAGTTTATVPTSGVFLGEVDGGNNWGANVFTGGAGSFQLYNSQTGAGGSDPWWNTKASVIQITDPVTSLTVNMNHLRGDGAGVNIGFDTSFPTSARQNTWGRMKHLYR